MMEKNKKNTEKSPGLKMALSYGYVPCKLGLCGPKGKKEMKIIEDFLSGNGELAADAESLMKEFKGAYQYYKLIASANKIRDIFDESVVEAYWTGNALLDKIRIEDLKKMMRSHFLPLGYLKEGKIGLVSDKYLAYHNSHVLRIGSVTGTLKETKKGLELCRISWGKVKRIGKNYLIVKFRPLEFGKKIKLGKYADKKIQWNRKIMPEAGIGDWISIHWNMAVEKLGKKKLENIKKYTGIVLSGPVL